MTRDWRTFWEDHPRRFRDTEFREQVGRTAHGGIPTPEAELDHVVAETARILALGPDHRLLDLCCGNGFLTRRLAERVGEVVGVDFSRPMLEVARRHHAAGNVRYREGSVLELERVLEGEPSFPRVCMLESLHYFEPRELPVLLEGLRARTTPDALLYFSGVPDRERQDAFFDTPERRREYERRKAAGTDGMGHWWSEEELRRAAGEAGLRCEILPQSPALHTAYYRFDVLFHRS